MFVDILPDIPEDDGTAYLTFYLEEDEDKEEILRKVQRGAGRDAAISGCGGGLHRRSR